MSTLKVEVCDIKDIKEHQNADALDIAIIKGWECIIKKGQYKIGDSVVYFPIDSVLPDELSERLGVKNYLKGKDKNRVGCAKLRGEMSYGLVINNEKNWEVGTDVTEYYGVTKYIPPVRATAGDAAPEDPFFDKFTEIENIKNFVDVFKEGEMVGVTEKIDGTCCRLSVSVLKDDEGNIVIENKAGSSGYKRKFPGKENIASNTYWYPWSTEPVKNLMLEMAKKLRKEVEEGKSYASFHLYGEVYGAVRGGHKSMHYGRPTSLNFIAFAAKRDNKYINFLEFFNLCHLYNIDRVPVVGIINFSWDGIKELSQGDSILAETNKTKHIREGVVVVPMEERTDPILGRVILKVINPDYLIMKNKKEDKGEEVDFKDE